MVVCVAHTRHPVSLPSCRKKGHSSWTIPAAVKKPRDKLFCACIIRPLQQQFYSTACLQLQWPRFSPPLHFTLFCLAAAAAAREAIFPAFWGSVFTGSVYWWALGILASSSSSTSVPSDFSCTFSFANRSTWRHQTEPARMMARAINLHLHRFSLRAFFFAHCELLFTRAQSNSRRFRRLCGKRFEGRSCWQCVYGLKCILASLLLGLLRWTGVCVFDVNRRFVCVFLGGFVLWDVVLILNPIASAISVCWAIGCVRFV